LNLRSFLSENFKFNFYAHNKGLSISKKHEKSRSFSNNSADAGASQNGNFRDENFTSKSKTTLIESNEKSLEKKVDVEKDLSAMLEEHHISYNNEEFSRKDKRKETSFNASITQENKRFYGRDYEDVDDLDEDYEDELEGENGILVPSSYLDHNNNLKKKGKINCIEDYLFSNFYWWDFYILIKI
jgi:hypothetical protein